MFIRGAHISIPIWGLTKLLHSFIACLRTNSASQTVCIKPMNNRLLAFLENDLRRITVLLYTFMKMQDEIHHTVS